MDTFNINILPEENSVNITQGEPVNISVSQEVVQISKIDESVNLEFLGDVTKIDANYPEALAAAQTAIEKAAEIEQTVEQGTADFNANAVAKTNDFNDNASAKTQDYNDNAVAKTTTFNDNATAKTSSFDTNATNKTNAFNQNATDKTLAFNTNAATKQAEVDASAALAKQYAIGDPSEPTGNSAKYWAEQASSELSGLTSRVTAIEGKIPADASSSNQLADKGWVGNQGYITGITSGDVTSALGYTPYNSSNPDGYITGISSSDVTTALGYTPYNSTNPNGYTSNVGTVTSVNNTSPDGSGNVTITIPNPLPSQTGNSGKFLTTDGTDPSWADVDALPSQTGQSGKFLTTDGTDASWATVGALPSQTGQSGKFLTTDGTDPSWADVDALPSQTGHSGDVLTTDGTDASWVDTDTIYPVVETYVNGTEWYRVYSDGWVEQGGYVSASGVHTVNFLKPFADTNYTIVKTMATTSTNTGVTYAQLSFYNRSATSAQTTTASAEFSWMACGYGA